MLIQPGLFSLRRGEGSVRPRISSPGPGLFTRQPALLPADDPVCFPDAVLSVVPISLVWVHVASVQQASSWMPARTIPPSTCLLFLAADRDMTAPTLHHSIAHL